MPNLATTVAGFGVAHGPGCGVLAREGTTGIKLVGTHIAEHTAFWITHSPSKASKDSET